MGKWNYKGNTAEYHITYYGCSYRGDPPDEMWEVITGWSNLKNFVTEYDGRIKDFDITKIERNGKVLLEVGDLANDRSDDEVKMKELEKEIYKECKTDRLIKRNIGNEIVRSGYDLGEKI